jgi:gliding motility-associated-like protein
VSCANVGTGCDGQATATAAYSDGSGGSFNFTWESGEASSGATASSAVELCAGLQSLTISDGICFVDTTVFIPAPLPIVPGQQITNVSCFGGTDGQVTLLPGGGTPPYQITWNSGVSGNTLSNLPAGSYGALITDAKGCSFTHTVLVDEPEPFLVSLNVLETADISCPGGADGVVSLVLQGGNLAAGPPVFLWQGGVAQTNSPVAEGLLPGTYGVTVVDVKGCETSLSHTLSEPPPITFLLEDVEPIRCFGETTFVTVASVSGGSPGPYVFSVNNGIDKLPGEYAPVLAGTHIVTVTDALLGCSADTTVVVDQPLELAVQLPAVVEIELGDTLTTLDPAIFSSLPIESFLWEPADQLSCTDCKNPRVNAVRSQRYTLTVVDINGCTAVTQILVDIDRNRNIFIPNVFSPNGDGVNDRFQVFSGLGVERIDFLRVYDRWGNMLFEALDLEPSVDGTNPAWDGSFRGETMDPGDFLYLVQVRFLDGQVLLYRGDVVLAR